MSWVNVGAVSANSTSPAIGVSGLAAPGAVMMHPILSGPKTAPKTVNIEPGGVKEPQGMRLAVPAERRLEA